MENEPNFRIIGNISEEKKDEQKQLLKGQLYGKHLTFLSKELQTDIEKLEYEKTPEQLMLIGFANQKTNDLMKKCGVSLYNIPAKNLHMIPQELYKKICGDDSYSVTLFPQQAVFFDANEYRKNDFHFGTTAFHEILHLKGHFSVEINETPEGKLTRTPYREGVGIRALQKSGLRNEYYEYFRGLHEAIVSSYEEKYIQEMLELPTFKEEKEWLTSTEAGKKITELAHEKNMPEKEIYWISKDGKEYKTFLYPALRKVFHYVIEEIYTEYSSEFTSQEEIKTAFLKSHFTGHLLAIANLVERTFGSGSFRLLGMMNNNETALQVLKSLKGFRSNELKNHRP